MNIPKDLARKTGRFHSVSPNDLDGFDDYAEWLEAILHEPCSVWEEDDGQLMLLEIRQLVARINGIKIEVYPNEHPPPHFHVKSPNIDASFCIESCGKLEGKVSSQDHLKIKFWHQSSKALLVDSWNKTRPTGCVVGMYNGT